MLGKVRIDEDDSEEVRTLFIEFISMIVGHARSKILPAEISSAEISSILNSIMATRGEILADSRISEW